MRSQKSKTVKKIIVLLQLLFTFSLMSGVSQAETNVSGNISTDTTWTLTNSPYVVTGTVQVLSGVTLTIEPGVTVKFNQGTLLRIGGELIAEGTETQMITFTSNEPTPSPGDWGPIEFVEGAVGSTLDENGEYVSGSIIKFCHVEYGEGIRAKELYIGYSNFCNNHIAMTIFNPSTIKHNRIFNNYLGIGTGYNFFGSPGLIITENVVTNNTEGISVYTLSCNITGNTY
ncbi:MAG: hypothetical protein V2A69_09595 [Pseudomonadota bacterium]